ncbi:ImmA/IrrE family metallo-endopeptidase [Nocardioides sp. SR21]|uniref:ImmA/IrrE family metallo-endopeptidase n=1 Tax=Nocardioides sp. SR21 TaxID=2919501 RepID=UPI001FAA8803|nr:ImmA/IrrE family metallo-endopeptidase [Nocardioides sp. SR21]
MHRFDELAQHAADLRIDVAWTFDLPGDIHAFYEHDDRLIVLNHRCTQAQVIGALAHEVGHAVFGDRCSTEAIERRADEYGASLVIGRDEYADAESLVGPHAGALARQLDVTRDLVLAWRRWWWRIGRLEEAA